MTGNRDIVECSTSVVVASKTDQGISGSYRLGIVPYGDGEVTIRHKNKNAIATITVHLSGQ